MNRVNLFFACDDSYVPFLAVTLTSIKENRDPSRQYDLRILETGLQEENKQRLTALFHQEDFALEFVDITPMVEQIADRLHTRDYYSKSTYYRLFIPELFPELDKALYLDSDLVVCGDICRLYDTPLGDNLVAAVPDGIVNTVKFLRQYAEKRLNLDSARRYFNAGVLLMNLEAMRGCNFSEIFLKLLQRVTFRVAQDQDYLNVICRDRVEYLGYEWNTMPTGIRAEAPQLVHYNMDSKPWQRDDVPLGELFWDYAARSGYLPEIRSVRAAYTQEQIDRSAEQTVNLVKLGRRQARQWTRNKFIHWQIRQVVDL